MEKYRLFDHTADIGCEIFGRTRKELFANAVAALFDLMLEQRIDSGKYPVQTMPESLGETFTKRYKQSNFVIPAKAGIQYFEGLPGFRVKPGMTNKKIRQKSLDEKRITIVSSDLEDLLINFLREALYLFNGKKWVITGCQPSEITRKRIVVQLHGKPYNPKQHHVKTEIKAVTYHGLSIKKIPRGWKARVIFDV